MEKEMLMIGTATPVSRKPRITYIPEPGYTASNIDPALLLTRETD